LISLPLGIGNFRTNSDPPFDVSERNAVNGWCSFHLSAVDYEASRAMPFQLLLIGISRPPSEMKSHEFFWDVNNSFFLYLCRYICFG
jgi:hypothetical protein